MEKVFGSDLDFLINDMNACECWFHKSLHVAHDCFLSRAEPTE